MSRDNWTYSPPGPRRDRPPTEAEKAWARGYAKGRERANEEYARGVALGAELAAARRVVAAAERVVRRGGDEFEELRKALLLYYTVRGEGVL